MNILDLPTDERLKSHLVSAVTLLLEGAWRRTGYQILSVFHQGSIGAALGAIADVWTQLPAFEPCTSGIPPQNGDFQVRFKSHALIKSHKCMLEK